MATWSFMCFFLTWAGFGSPFHLRAPGRRAPQHVRAVFPTQRDRRHLGRRTATACARLPCQPLARPGVGSGVRNLFGSTTGAIMADKSPRQTASKKSAKSIKEKRADKRAAAAPASSLDKTSAKPVPAKKK